MCSCCVLSVCHVHTDLQDGVLEVVEVISRAAAEVRRLSWLAGGVEVVEVDRFEALEVRVSTTELVEQRRHSLAVVVTALRSIGS